MAENEHNSVLQVFKDITSLFTSPRKRIYAFTVSAGISVLLVCAERHYTSKYEADLVKYKSGEILQKPNLRDYNPVRDLEHWLLE